MQGVLTCHKLGSIRTLEDNSGSHTFCRSNGQCLAESVVTCESSLDLRAVYDLIEGQSEVRSCVRQVESAVLRVSLCQYGSIIAERVYIGYLSVIAADLIAERTYDYVTLVYTRVLVAFILDLVCAFLVLETYDDL